MSNVIDLSSRRPKAPAECDCPGHRLGSLIARLQDHIETHDGQLLIDGPQQIEMFTAVINTVTDALNQNQRRTNP